MDEHLLPRHLDVLAQHHAVAFVVAPGQRGVELGRGREHGRFARPQREPRCVARHRAGDRFLLLVGSERDHVAEPDVVGIEGAGRQHLHAGDDDAIVVLAHHPQRGHRNILLVVELRITGGLRRHHGVDDIGVVVADVAVIGHEVVGVRAGRRQRIGLHGHAGDERGDVIGRAAEHAEGGIGDLPVPHHAALQIIARARTQKIDGVAAAILLIAQRVAVRRVRLHVVDGGNRRGGVPEGRMARDVVDLLAADIDDAAVAQRFQMLLARPQHHPLLIVAGTLACRIAGDSARCR